MGKKSQKQKIVLPPELPPEIAEDEIEVSDEDLQFVKQNSDYAVGFSRLDTQSITKSVLSLHFLFFSIFTKQLAFRWRNGLYLFKRFFFLVN